MNEHSGDFFDIHHELAEAKAGERLSCVGLDIKDLKDRGSVVDLGAKDCWIERAARQHGIDNVVSVDINFPEEVTRMGLNQRIMDAKHLEFVDSSINLVISRAGPIFIEKKEAEALEILREMNRVVSPEPHGEIRIHPARFGFIQQRLFSEHSEYFDAAYRPGLGVNPLEARILIQYNLLANRMSMDYLEKSGFNFEIGMVDNLPQLSEDLQTFFVLKKRV